MISLAAFSFVTAQDFRPKKSDLKWGKDDQGLRMAVWTNFEAMKVFGVVRNFSKKKICYCDYVLGKSVKIYARKHFNHQWQEVNFRPPTPEEKANMSYIGSLPCSDNKILQPGKEMPPFKEQFLGNTQNLKNDEIQNYSFAIDLSEYVFPENLSGIVDVKIVQTIFNGHCDDAFEGDLESEPFRTEIQRDKPTPNNLTDQQKQLIKEKAFELKDIYNASSYGCSDDGWNSRRFYFDYPDKQIVDAEIVSLLVGYEKSGFATASIALPRRLQTDAVRQLFPNYRFYTICWSEIPVKENPVMGLGMGIYYTLAIDEKGNTTKLSGSGGFEEFGEFISKNKVRIKNSEDARILWLAFCDISQKPWHSRDLKQISPTEWNMGIYQTNEPVRIEQYRSWFQFILDDNQQVLSVKSMSETLK